MIRIMKASAGSGKTYNLAKTYIRLLLCQEDRYAYRHILAVTFTNKATEEMKSRILKELHVLASDTESSPYLKDLLPSFDSVEDLRSRAGIALCDILHDYSAFAISTIDRFFQQTLKAFSKEIGHFATYQVELDTKSLVDESVDRVLDSLSEEEPALLQWLTQGVMDDIRQGNRYNLDRNLKSVAASLRSDEHRTLVEKYGLDEEKAYSKERLSAMKKAMSGIVEAFRKDVVEAAKAFFGGCGSVGIDIGDFSGSSFKKLQNYCDLKPKDRIQEPTEAIYKRSVDFNLWFRKDDRNKFEPYEDFLLGLLQNFVDLFGERFKVYNTAFAIGSQLNELGIAGDLRREFDDLLKEKNVMCLDDSNVILRNIIDGADAPFIYEKLGVRFEHFLLDEFQDTSRIQWDNFRPLVKESDSCGHESLLVGDVKQSIYRWRGSDWKLMADDVGKTFPESIEDTLDSNYRSLSDVVGFNNGFFAWASARLDDMLGEHDGRKIASIYSDCEQKVMAKDCAEGSVDVVFCQPDDEMAAILSEIDRVRASGARLGDITILVRENRQGSEVAMSLLDNGISVISDDSLHLKSSPLIRQLVSLMSVVGESDDNIASFLASELDADVRKITSLSLSDLCESLVRVLETRDKALFDSQTQYIQSFMDFVQDHSALHGNSLDAFLKAWADADPKISSPSDPDSVRVMTIHKSKGLEFNHLIIPHAEKNTLFMDGRHWARPDLKGTELEGVADGIYNVHLSKPSRDCTLFKSECFNEMYMQYIDGINTFYVAMTRAVKGLTVISAMPPKDCIDAAEAGDVFEFKDFSQMLWHYLQSLHDTLGFDREDDGCCITFSKGSLYDYSSMARNDEGICELSPGYPSFPLNPLDGNEGTDVRQRGRLKFSADSIDFFCDEAKADISARLNGTVMHAILAEVGTAADLHVAVLDAVLRGDIDPGDAQKCEETLSSAISAHPEWFAADGLRIFPEVSLIDTDGKEYRPDRVVMNDGSVTVIDYKFGEKNPRYRAQVEHYADIYRRMGYDVADAVVWYVPSDAVE